MKDLLDRISIAKDRHDKFKRYSEEDDYFHYTDMALLNAAEELINNGNVSIETLKIITEWLQNAEEFLGEIEEK